MGLNGKMETHINAPARVTAGGATQEVLAPMCPQNRPPDPRHALAKEMAQAGVRHREIATKFGVNVSTIHRWVHDKTYKPKPWDSEPVDHPRWVGDNSDNVMTGHHRARRLYRMGPCELCGKQGLDRHHKDGNTFNNKPENVQILCRRCHMEVDGRLAQLTALANEINSRPPDPPKPCSRCGRAYKPLRRGLCSRCYDKDYYWRSPARRARASRKK